MKSKIKSNLFTNGGEFILQDSQKEYVGWYNIDGEENIFTEKTFLNEKSLLLLPINLKQTIYEQNVKRDVSKIKRQKDVKSYFPRITEDNIEQGFIERYFVKKNNVENILLKEVDRETYFSIKNQEGFYLDSLYTIYEIVWWIGKISEIECVNRNKEQIKKQPILNLLLIDLNEFYTSR